MLGFWAILVLLRRVLIQEKPEINLSELKNSKIKRLLERLRLHNDTKLTTNLTKFNIQLTYKQRRGAVVSY